MNKITAIFFALICIFLINTANAQSLKLQNLDDNDIPLISTGELQLKNLENDNALSLNNEQSFQKSELRTFVIEKTSGIKFSDLKTENADPYPKGLSAAFSLESRNTFLLGDKAQVIENYSPLDANTYNVGIFTGRLLVGKRYGLILNARVDNAGQNPEQKEEVQGYVGLGLTAYIVKDAFRIDAYAGPTFKKSDLNGRSTSWYGGVGVWFGGSKLPSIEGTVDINFNNSGCKYIYGKFVYEINDFLNIGFVSEKNMGRKLRIGPVLETKVIASDILSFKITGGLTAGSEDVWNAFFGIRANIHTR